MKKNTASQVIGAQMVSATDGSAFTGAVTCYVTGNGGTQAVGSVGSGACTHEGNGFHTYAPAQAETNYDHVAFTFIGTGAVPVTVQVYPSFPQTGDSFGLIGSTGSGLTSLASAANLATLAGYVDTEIADIQSRLPAALVSGRMAVDVIAISGDTAAADELERWMDGTAGSVYELGILDRGTAQSATSTTLVLRSAVGFADDALIGATILITGGTNAGQSARITDYVGSTDTATVESWPNGTPAGTITYVIFGTTPDTASSGGATAAEIADAVLDEALSGHTTAGTLGKAISDTLTATGTSIPATLSTIAGYVDTEVAAVLAAVDTEVAAIKAKTDNLPASPANEATLTTIAGYIDTEVAAIKAKTDLIPASPAAVSNIPTAAAIADAVWDEAISGHLTSGTTGAALNASGASGDPWETSLPGSYAAGTAGYIVGTNLDAAVSSGGGGGGLDAAGVRAAIGLASANLDTQLGTLDTNVDAVKAKTDSLTFTTGGKVDANVTHINETEVGGVGTSGNPWGPV